ncbi:GNAT family N-acetyltransferase [Gymnodinialimonas ceratoperidinii]|uniref:GNAT family N-acetyltransferase n=1 Tax=Gymnodinialimonas ceratoperidinii TaxID=2856823 RepID=A0A8F6TWV3_9RHOB|nr:GNAT family N-acetyltransferase [Gymnodinialimonas ceratoperidinii]QXT40155.1 GNAT family N-acetyltransferase [Gymnodinialimonas ceratoperidinii]
MIIRPAHDLDAGEIAALLREIIAIGGTTAITGEINRSDILAWMARPGGAWHVAETEEGEILGFQYLAPNSALPPEAVNIATFAKPGKQGLGIGSKLFQATRETARALGYLWINADIRADNESGLAYYQSRGFEDYGRIDGYEMADGTIVDKILKRYDLKDA